MSTRPILVLSPEGQYGHVPPEKLQDAITRGFKQAVNVTSPEGQAGLMPLDNAGEAIRRGFTIGQPKTELEKPGLGTRIMQNPTAQRAAGAVVGAGESFGIPATQSPVSDAVKQLADQETPFAKVGSVVGAPAPVSNFIGSAVQAHVESGKKAIGKAKEAASTLFSGKAPFMERARQASSLASEAATQGLATAIPFLGPAAANAGERLGKTIDSPDPFEQGQGIGNAAGVVGQAVMATKPGQKATETAIAKVAQPVEALATKTASTVVNAGKLARGLVDPTTLPADSAFIKATKPNVSIRNVREKVSSALPQVRRVLDEQGIDPSKATHQDALNATLQAKRDVWSAVERQLSPNGKYLIPGDEIASKIQAKVGDMTPMAVAEHGTSINKAGTIIEQYKGKPIPLEMVENRIQELNNELASKQVGGMTEAKLRNDPQYGYKFAELDALRSMEERTMNMLSGAGLKDLKNKYGALKTVQGVLEKSTNVAERASDVPLFEGLGRMGAAGKVVKGVFTASPGEVLGGAAEYAMARKNALANNRTFMLQQALSKTEAAPHPLSQGVAGGFAPPFMQSTPRQLKSAPIVMPPSSKPVLSLPPWMMPERLAPQTNRVEPVGIPQSAEASAMQNAFERNPAPFMPQPEQPKFAYRVRDVGEKGVPIKNSHSQATLSADEAKTYVEGRGSLTGKPQETVKVDLSKLQPADYRVMDGPNGAPWVKFNKEVPESAVTKEGVASVPKNGQPFSTKAYHASSSRFEKFDMSKSGKTTDDGYLGRGVYLSTDPKIVRSGEVGIEANVSLDNPLRVELPNMKSSKKDVVRAALGLEKSATADEVTSALKQAGHDGVVLDYGPTGYKHQEIMVTNPDSAQIVPSKGESSLSTQGVKATQSAAEKSSPAYVERTTSEQRTKDAVKDVAAQHEQKALQVSELLKNEPPEVKQAILKKLSEGDSPKVQSAVVGGESAAQGTPAPGKTSDMKVADISQSPGRFQYKLNTDAAGVGTLLKEQTKFNPDLAGVITVWKDPADGNTYVVNGHHRLELAKRTGQESVTVRNVVANDASEARAIGALQNIAEGRGTPIDAAKFMRDSGITLDDLKGKGISLGEATASKGAALSHLDDGIFSKVVAGEIPIERGVTIGEATPDHAEQRAIAELVDKSEKKGKKISNDTLAELIRFVKGSDQHVTTTSSLFGEESVSQSLALEKAEVSAYIKNQLSKDKKLFGYVSKESRASDLERGNNIIDVATSKKVATEAAQGEEIYNKLSNRGGPIADILDNAAERIANGENSAKVKQEAFDDIRTELSQTLSGGQGSGSGSGKATAKRDFSVGGKSDKAEYSVRARRGELDWAGSGLSPEQLSSWSKSKSLAIEEAGEQGSLLGEPDKLFRIQRMDADGQPERALITEKQLNKLIEGGNKNVISALMKAGIPVPGLGMQWTLPRAEVRQQPNIAPFMRPQESSGAPFMKAGEGRVKSEAVKIPKKLYRGVSDSGEGTGAFTMGKGVYSSASKEFASKYGTKVVELNPRENFPSKPLILKPYGDPNGAFVDWLLKESGAKNLREFNKQWSDPGEFVRSKGFDGVVVGDEIVKYPEGK